MRNDGTNTRYYILVNMLLKQHNPDGIRQKYQNMQTQERI